MVKELGDWGYNVDIMNDHDRTIRLTKQYDLIIDSFPQNRRIYENNLKRNCFKVFYSTDANPFWHNRQHELRVKALNLRRHARLQVKASLPPFNHELNDFDALFLTGNQRTLSTFSDIPFKKTAFIKNSANRFPDVNISQKMPNTFLFLATYPQVLKGLDLLLEVFAKLPDCSLIICSQFQNEKDFCSIYLRELYQLPNILPIGFVDISSNIFKKVIQVSSYVLLPSCAEGMSGSILTAMAAGVIPIVSYECGFNEPDVFFLEQCTIDCIRSTVKTFAQKPLSWIQQQSYKTQEIARAHYSASNFSDSFADALQKLIK
jgi:glycosyltransferase involved in cell wall biosynthesis